MNLQDMGGHHYFVDFFVPGESMADVALVLSSKHSYCYSAVKSLKALIFIRVGQFQRVLEDFMVYKVGMKGSYVLSGIARMVASDRSGGC